jgi:oligopeptide transport system substrate-binding protein
MSPRVLVLALAAALAGFGLAGCGRKKAESATPAGAAPASLLRIAQRNEPATLDPQLATLPDEFFVIRALSEGLYRPRPEGGAEPALAEAHDVSADGLVHTFRLRAARWSNGDPVTAGDFVFSAQRMLTAALAAPKARLFFGLRHAAAYYRGEIGNFAAVGIAAPDARTLVITLERPLPDFLNLVASGPWIPVHPATIERHGGLLARNGAWTKPGHFVGNGPYTLAEWSPAQHLLVRRNPAYFLANRVHVDALRFQAYDNGDTEERAFRAGQVDVTLGIPFTKLGAYASPPRQVLPLYETRYLTLNTQRPPLDDPRVRRALALALDRRALIDAVLRGGQQPAWTFIPPGLGGYQPPASGAPDLARDRATARDLLAAAGFPGGRNFPALEIATWTNVPLLEAIQQMWRQELGIEVTILQREARVHLAGLAAGDYTIALAPTLPDYDSAGEVLGLFAEGSAENYPHWRLPAYDEAVAAIDRATGPAERLARQRDAEALLLEALPVIPLYFNTQNYLVAPRVRGWRQDGLWNRCYLDLTLTP